ncbi:MAG TPA: flagellar basal-body rod protein FlgF [Chromatiales bacterium]|nr:flagellar basal-body rod protein FlgF [Chromatiales bacterium]HEX22460.1 flagellar basal-body rod protein FlgF [Chromatiales bacterium]
MDRMLYVAMSGAKQTALAQAVNSNNLANANTTGFREDLAAFRSMPVFGAGAPTRVYAMTENPGVNLESGAIQATGRDLDMAIQGSGWLAVQAPDGQEAYTRAGNLRIESGGLLVTGSGYPVMGNGGPIAVPQAESLEIGVDGTITIRSIGEFANSLTVLDRIKLVNPDGAELIKGKDGLMRLKDGFEADADASVRLASGALETSNVNTVDAMVNMIALARQYEAQVKMMKAAGEMASKSNELLSLS